MSEELTREQIERLDFMHNLVHDLVCDLSGKEDLEWDMEVIGEVVDVIEAHVCGKLKLMTEQEFNPYLEAEEES